MKTLVRKAALLVIALSSVASASGCAADPKAQADRGKPAKGAAVYYHDQVETSANDIETYDRWRQLFGS
jgi:hypothetical protein